MLKIDGDKSHIEHFKPQYLCKQEDQQRIKKGERTMKEDIDWNNLLACHPKSTDAKTRPAAYGAFKKADFFDPDLLINPKQEDPSNHLEFRIDGSVIHKTDKGQSTIEILGLNHPVLQKLREASFIELGLSFKSKKPCSESAALRLADMAKHDGLEFAGAIPDAVNHYLTRLRRRKTRQQEQRTKRQSA
ncbi:MAG: hypothetical protein EAZ99_07695 [Alphaproteobacteria bacterium]|nr:MAG: hypothetical protein EAZ99_07695 [Alphaproteobacteria bacterium]